MIKLHIDKNGEKNYLRKQVFFIFQKSGRYSFERFVSVRRGVAKMLYNKKTCGKTNNKTKKHQYIFESFGRGSLAWFLGVGTFGNQLALRLCPWSLHA